MSDAVRVTYIGDGVVNVGKAGTFAKNTSAFVPGEIASELARDSKNWEVEGQGGGGKAKPAAAPAPPPAKPAAKAEEKKPEAKPAAAAAAPEKAEKAEAAS
jgi:hypothetical protein